MVLDGALNITLLNGFIPSITDQFTIMTYTGSLGGTFSSVILPSPEMDGFSVDYGNIIAGAITIMDITILDVEFAFFEANVMESEFVMLKWGTESETNNSHFEVERSVNGIDFEMIGRVQGSGTYSAPQAYQFVDEATFHGILYYRLKQVDLDGQFEYSDTRTVHLELNELEIVVYPNPVHDILTI